MSNVSRIPPRTTADYESRFEPLLDSDEAAALLKIHPKTLQRMARNREIPGIQIGKLWRFRASQLNEWMAQFGNENSREQATNRIA
ncbi:MAG TPA: helix-turn-helix domain-containing protein [Terriglobales bacterium]|nr:helix-turn-helix domain-containing protein [Terriglobales bacterium]